MSFSSAIACLIPEVRPCEGAPWVEGEIGYPSFEGGTTIAFPLAVE